MNFYEQIFSRGLATGEGMTHFERLFAAKFGGSPPPEVREYTGAVPVTITADGTPLIDYLISGNTTQSGTPTPDSPIMPEGCGELDTGQYKIPISSAGQTNNIYLGEVQSTRQIYKLVLTGQETGWNFNEPNNVFYLLAPNAMLIADSITSICTHYKAVGNKSLYINMSNNEVCIRANDTYLWIKDTTYSTVTDFKTYLQQQYANGTPVTVWYVLTTPQTAVVNEPLMRIGDYADTLSKEQAGVQIPTNNGSTTIDVDTTVKPSEMYIKYMG